jgi:hypothetical protein
LNLVPTGVVAVLNANGALLNHTVFAGYGCPFTETNAMLTIEIISIAIDRVAKIDSLLFIFFSLLLFCK